MTMNHELGRYRELFSHPDPDLIYLDGNSLGRMPKAAVELGESLLNKGWATKLIRGWNSGWMDLSQKLGDKVAQIIGTDPGTVVIADSTSVNLYKLVIAALATQPGRNRVITDDLNFPSDLYILAEVTRDAHQLDVIGSDGVHGPVDKIVDSLDESVALVALSATAYHSGYTYDTGLVTEAAHAVGAMVLWDLSHTAGSVPVDLAKADLAVGCCYKYLNGGPGAPAFLYVSKDLQGVLSNPIPGWMSHKSPFTFDSSFKPQATIRRFLTGTPPVMSMALIEPGLDIHLEAGTAAVRRASLELTNRFIEGYDRTLQDLGFALLSPREHNRRGSHITLGHENALAIDQALINEYKIVPDFRPPNGIRFGFAPLYNSLNDVDSALLGLRRIVTEGSWIRYTSSNPIVT